MSVTRFIHRLGGEQNPARLDDTAESMVIDHSTKNTDEIEIDLTQEHIEPMLQRIWIACIISNRAT